MDSLYNHMKIELNELKNSIKLIEERQHDLREDVERIYKAINENHTKIYSLIQNYAIQIMITLGICGVSGIGYFLHYMNKYMMSG